MNVVQRLRQAAETSLRALNPESAPDAAEQPLASGLLPHRKARWRDWVRHRPYIVLATFVLLAAALWLMFRPLPVSTAQVTRGEAVDVVYATGVVDHVHQARISPVVAAPILRVFVDEGQQVSRGTLLAQLDDGPARGTAAQLAAQASMARLAADRTQRLFKAGYASVAAWDDARGQRDAANAAARSARARLADYTISAPFAGTVLRRDAEPGDLASPSQVLFFIADENSLRITADLDERDIGRIAVGQRAIVRADAFPGQTFDVPVTQITPQGDSTTRLFRVRCLVAKGSPLRAGMTVEVNIIAGRRQNAVLVPAQALRGNVVWTVDNKRAHRREIERGATGGALVEIRKGLGGGEAVILDPPESLREGARVSARLGSAVIAAQAS